MNERNDHEVWKHKQFQKKKCMKKINHVVVCVCICVHVCCFCVCAFYDYEHILTHRLSNDTPPSFSVSHASVTASLKS